MIRSDAKYEKMVQMLKDLKNNQSDRFEPSNRTTLLIVTDGSDTPPQNNATGFAEVGLGIVILVIWNRRDIK